MSAAEGWESKPIGKFAKTVSGGTPATHVSAYWQNGTIPWLNSGELSQHDYVREPTTLITEKAVRFSAAKLVPKGSVGIALTGATTGKVGFFEIETTTNQSIVAILPNPTVDTLYLFHFLERSRNQILSFNIGSAQPHINKQIVDEFLVEFPTAKSEQTKIAEVLSTVDRAIEQTEALIAKQQRIKTGLMQDLITRGVDEHGTIRSEETHQFKDSPLGRIPVEWKIETLNNCVRPDAPICYGILMPGPGYDDGIPVIKVKNIIGGRIVQDDILLTDPKIDANYKRSRLRAGDLLLTIRGTTGRLALVPPELDGANITQDTARVRLKEEMSSQFFYFLLQSFPLQNQIRLHTLGQAVKGINIGEVKKLFFGVPDENEQKAIANRLGAIQERIYSSEREMAKQAAIKTALMQDLLSGKVQITPLLTKLDKAS